MAGVFEIAHRAKLPGVETTMVLYPDRIGVRLRKSVERMLIAGVSKGYGKAARISRMMMKQQGISFVDQSNYGVLCHGRFRFDDNFARIQELFDAYVVVESVSYHHHQTATAQVTAMKERLRQVREGRQTFLPVYNVELCEQIAEAVAQCRPLTHRHEGVELANQFIANKPFTIKFSN